MAASAVRIAAFRTLSASFEYDKYSNIELDNAISRGGFSGQDKNFFVYLYLGVTEKKISLDYLIARFSDIPSGKLEDCVKVILEMGIFQLLFADSVPDRAAIYESVELAKEFSRGGAGLVNGILRKIASDKDYALSLLSSGGRKKAMSLEYSYPKWLISLWCDAYGEETAKNICIAQNTPPSLSVRINEKKVSIADYLKELDRQGAVYAFSNLDEKALLIKSISSPSDLPGFESGWFFVQDAAAMCAVSSLGCRENDRIIDVCASPGGKSFAAALDTNDNCEVFSFDIHEKRVGMIKDGTERLGLSSVKCSVNDAEKPKTELFGTADKVICDVPCSGYGVISKKPDIRLKSKEESALLPLLQKNILNQSVKYLKKSGVLLYSTCTLNPDENERITDTFLEENTDYERIGEPRTIFPEGGKNDGFFFDLIRKK